MATENRLLPRTFAHFTENLQSQGRYTFTKQEAIQALGISDNAVRKAALLLVHQKRLMRIVNEFYAIIPFEYKNSGGVPATHYIDELMKFEQQPYYVGLLSAAALHGAAHQSPQELQIVTSKPLPLIQAGRSRIRFLTRNNLSNSTVQTMKTQTGYIQVSTPEATAFDLIRFPKIAAGLNNIATVLKELSEVMNANKLGQLAAMTETAFIQRLGFLLDLVGAENLSLPLNSFLVNSALSLANHRWDFTLLRPGQKKGKAARDQKWRIIINDTVEPDV